MGFFGLQPNKQLVHFIFVIFCCIKQMFLITDSAQITFWSFSQLTGLRYIRGRLSDDNVVENQEKSHEEELSAKNFFKTKRKADKHVLDLYLASDNEHFDIFEGRCASLKN